MKTFDLVNPVIGKLATQVKAIKLTDYELTIKIYEKVKLTKFLNRQINQREKELAKIPKGIVENQRSTINFKQPDTWRSINVKLPDTPPSTPDDYWADVDQNWIPGGTPSAPLSGPSPPSLFDYDCDFPPLSKSVPEPLPSRETTFLSDGTILLELFTTYSTITF